MFYKLSKVLVLAFIAALASAPLALAEEEPSHYVKLEISPVTAEDPNAAKLKQAADQSLYLARHSIKTNGFFCADIELNIWQNLARRAGTFDETIYNELKTELYTSSMRHLDKWYTYYVKRGFYNDARKCLQTWRLHAMEIGAFDEAEYEKKTAALAAAKEN